MGVGGEQPKSRVRGQWQSWYWAGSWSLAYPLVVLSLVQDTVTSLLSVLISQSLCKVHPRVRAWQNVLRFQSKLNETPA